MGERGLSNYFSDHFGVAPATLEDYGALDISLIADLPLFVDPFLLFSSEKAEYRTLHDSIITYVKFLHEKSGNTVISDGLLLEWYCFGEVRQNWLGYCQLGNSGSGLGIGFGHSFNRALRVIFTDIGEEKITRGTHLEKVGLIREGVGRDNISDFTTNLIKGFLCSYTEQFALENLDRAKCREFLVERASFNYNLQKWLSKRYQLPAFGGDFVLLTPTDILTKDDNWINRTDLIDRFDRIPNSIPNSQIRATISNYFQQKLPRYKDKSPSRSERQQAVTQTIEKFPFLLDYYIRIKEDNESGAKSISQADLEFVGLVFQEAVRQISNNLPDDFFKYPPVGSIEEAHKRLAYLKDVIENKGGHRFFYIGDTAIRREKDLHVLYRLVWYNSRFDISAEANDGRGPVDFKIAYGSKDKSLVEFKLANNTQLKANLQKQTAIYERASDAQRSIKAIVYFSDSEHDRVDRILKELDMKNDKDIVLIDASKDNKPSGSKAR